MDILSVGRVYIQKVKQSPLQVWTGIEGSRRMRLPDFETIGTRRL